MGQISSVSSQAYTVLAVIASYNDENAIRRILKDLKNSHTRPNEILIIDNSFQALDPEIIRNYPLPINVIRTGKNVGWSGGYEIAFHEASKKDITGIWLLDQDSRPTPDCLDKLLLTKTTLDNNIGILSPIVLEEKTLTTVLPAQIGDDSFKIQEDFIPYKNGLVISMFPITSGSLIDTSLGEIATSGIEGMCVDCVDWVVAYNFRRKGYYNLINTNAIMLHSLGNPEKIKFIGKLLTLRYNQKRILLQAKNKSYFTGYINLNKKHSFRYLKRIFKEYLIQNTLLLVTKKISMVDYIRTFGQLHFIYTEFRRGANKSL